MKKNNVYDELSDAESSILKMAEQGLSNGMMAKSLGMTYGSLCVLKSAMRKKGIYIHQKFVKNGGLTDEVKREIIRMDKEGFTNEAISDVLGTPLPTIHFWKQKMKKDGVVFLAKAGRPRTVHND